MGQSLLVWGVSEPFESNREEIGPGGEGEFLGPVWPNVFLKVCLFFLLPDDWGCQAQWRWYFMPTALENP
jgi:hypothetical protein